MQAVRKALRLYRRNSNRGSTCLTTIARDTSRPSLWRICRTLPPPLLQQSGTPRESNSPSSHWLCRPAATHRSYSPVSFPTPPACRVLCSSKVPREDWAGLVCVQVRKALSRLFPSSSPDQEYRHGSLRMSSLITASSSFFRLFSTARSSCFCAAALSPFFTSAVA